MNYELKVLFQNQQTSWPQKTTDPCDPLESLGQDTEHLSALRCSPDKTRNLPSH